MLAGRIRGGPRPRMLLAASLLALVPPVVAEPGPPAAPPSTPPAAPAIDRTTLLVRMDRAASLYRQAALRFACREHVRGGEGPMLHFEYLYVIGADGQLRDYRTRPGDSRAIEVSPRFSPVKHWLMRAYSWVFLFERNRWPHLRYRILETGQAEDRDVVLVEFEPVLPILEEINEWTGTAWVEPATGRIVRIEARKAEDLETMRLFEAAMAPGEQTPAGRHRFPVLSATTEFGVEKNGMLLPSKATVEIVEHSVPGRGGRPSSTHVVYRTVQTYENYRFFGVKAEEAQPPAVKPH